jgi:hypothetical protein
MGCDGVNAGEVGKVGMVTHVNNCPYYKNEKAYEKALTDLIYSLKSFE